jgi:hypothetical protein
VPSSSAAVVLPVAAQDLSFAKSVKLFRQEIGLVGDDKYNKLVLPHVLKHCVQIQSYVLGKVGTREMQDDIQRRTRPLLIVLTSLLVTRSS